MEPIAENGIPYFSSDEGDFIDQEFEIFENSNNKIDDNDSSLQFQSHPDDFVFDINGNLISAPEFINKENWSKRNTELKEASDLLLKNKNISLENLLLASNLTSSSKKHE